MLLDFEFSLSFRTVTDEDEKYFFDSSGFIVASKLTSPISIGWRDSDCRSSQLFWKDMKS